MANFNFLPGVIINTVDGGLDSNSTPTSQSTLIIGTAGQGPVNQPTQVTSSTTAVSLFGFEGDLIRSMEEVLAYSDNVILFRMGGNAQILSGIGAVAGQPGNPGFSATFGQNSSTANVDYQLWYKAGLLVIWYKNNLVFSNSEDIGLVDTGDIELSQVDISSFTGLQLGTGNSASLAGSISVQASTALPGTSTDTAPVLTPAVTGLGLSGRDTFVAFREAAELLTGVQVDQIYVPAAKLDAPNVAFYVSSDSTTSFHNPVTNPDALDWLKTLPATTDSAGVYQWAHQTVDSTGAVVAAMNAVTPDARLAAGFHEVNWGYELAKFAANVSGLNSTCLAILGTTGPASFKLVDVRKWLGSLPTYGADGVTPVSAGRGLLGCPYVMGTTSSKLNNLCADFVTGVRLPGFYQNSVGEYDGGADLDVNQNPIDIGAYLHAAADQVVLTNGYASNYITNFAGVVAGYLSTLDQKSALTNKPLRVTQIPGLVYTPGQLDALTQAKINVLRGGYTRSGVKFPTILHDMTCANSSSDYTLVLRVRIKGLVVKTMLNRASGYIGESSLDGLQLQSMKTALDKDLVNLTLRGYISKATVSISASTSQQRLGKANLFLKFSPANELVQLTAQVGITQ